MVGREVAVAGAFEERLKGGEDCVLEGVWECGGCWGWRGGGG